MFLSQFLSQSVPSQSSLSQSIKAEALRLGFARVGIVPAAPSRTHAFYEAWLARGYAGEMAYLHRHAQPKRDPAHWTEGARSIICLAASYADTGGASETPEAGPNHTPRGRISRYALNRDYHAVLDERLEALARFIEAEAGRPVRARRAVDAAPLMEREWAARAGLGWVGRNSLLIDWELGSYLFLAELLVDLELDYDDVPPGPGPRPDSHSIALEPPLPAIDLGLRESCGTCRACLDACPTHAIVADKTVDARRCVSYLTIELKGAIPAEFREPMGDWVFGCDICQEVCPWNRRASGARRGGDERHDGDAARPGLIELLCLDDTGFRERFRETPLWRTRRRGLLRNAAIALGNALTSEVTPETERVAVDALERSLHDAEPVIRGAAAWALGRAGTDAARRALRQADTDEHDPAVRAEIAAALGRRARRNRAETR